MAAAGNKTLSDSLVLTHSLIVITSLISNGVDKLEGSPPIKLGKFGPQKWAVLIAGSKGWQNYRHQADVCHAYQLLKRGGLHDDNIIVFMYDDIAYNPSNPRPGSIINHARGADVYKDTPKDYTGVHVTTQNVIAAVLGNKSAITGGSRKVVNSGPNDYIFIYYSDHGDHHLLSMPVGPPLYHGDLFDLLKRKHASAGYKSLLLYIEACFSGGLLHDLPKGLNVYATTAARGNERSHGTYCSRHTLPRGYRVCLGDAFSAAWMENSL